jgi:hypothetical protein
MQIEKTVSSVFSTDSTHIFNYSYHIGTSFNAAATMTSIRMQFRKTVLLLMGGLVHAMTQLHHISAAH